MYNLSMCFALAGFLVGYRIPKEYRCIGLERER